MKLNLIDGWGDAYKLFSVQLAALLIALDMGYEHLPVLQTYLPEGWVKWVAMAIIVARVIRQKPAAQKDL